MAGILPGDSSHHRVVESSPYKYSHERNNEHDCIGSSWYLSRKDIEENSPSRRDRIDLKKEAYFRKSYCTFLQDLGMRLKVPQVTIATSIVFCHRFFLRQSHAKNDRRTIATVCMFLAGKVEETPRPLKDVIMVSYEIINKKDPAAVQKIKQKEVCEHQKELILLGERVVLATLGFDLNVHHPYKPLVEAIKKFKVAQNALAQVAWNFVNDGLRTSLCLQFKPHHIAAGAIFLAAKFLKVKLPADGEKVWWQEFDVTPRQLEEVSNQMLELYEQNRAGQQSNGNEAEGSPAAGPSHRTASNAASPALEEPPTQTGHPPVIGPSSLHHASSAGRPVPNQFNADKLSGSHKTTQKENDYGGSREPKFEVAEYKSEVGGMKDRSCPVVPGNATEAPTTKFNLGLEHLKEDPGRLAVGGSVVETREKLYGHGEVKEGHSPIEAVMIDKDKVKAALEKRKRAGGEAAKTDLIDDDDLIERELENGIELAADDEKTKQDRRHSWPKPLHRHTSQDAAYASGENGSLGKGKENAEVAELPIESRDFHTNRKRKAADMDKHSEHPERRDFSHTLAAPKKHRALDGPLSSSNGQLEHAERDYKRHGHESQV